MSTTPKPEYVEACSMIALLEHGETIASLRALIGRGADSYRRKVRAYFECLLARTLLNRRRGTGLRLPRPVRELAHELLRGDISNVALNQRLGISGHTAARLRREAGNPGNPRRRKGARRKLSAQQIAQAVERLKNGEHWRHVARELDVTVKTLMTNAGYRKNRKWAPEEIDRARGAILAGETWTDAAKLIGRKKSVLQKRLGPKRSLRRERMAA
ncbi:MAG TPA: hypothetical protein VGI46_06830 [Candidatus Acidoferrum sp.]